MSQGSTIHVKNNTYSVPARLIGEWLEAWVAVETIEVRYHEQVVQTVPRLRGQDHHRIDYRHVIDWLVRKPGAFARYCYREELYPTTTFRQAYDQLVLQQPGRADREYLEILQQAAQSGEAQVAEVLRQLLQRQQPLSVQAVRTRLGQDTPLAQAEQVQVPAVDLEQYDALLVGGWQQVSDTQLSLGEARAVRTNGLQSLERSQDLGPSSSQEPRREGMTPEHSQVLVKYLQSLHLPAMRAQYEAVARQATAESWGYADYLLELLQRECQQRQQNRIDRLLKGSRLPLEKSWPALDLKRLPAKVVQQLRGLLSGDFLDRRENVLVFGPPGSGKTHCLAALGQELARSGSAGAVHDVRPVGARVAGGQTGPDV